MKNNVDFNQLQVFNFTSNVESGKRSDPMDQGNCYECDSGDCDGGGCDCDGGGSDE